MKIIIADNEFTGNDLLRYLHNVYGTQIDGNKFTHGNIFQWEKSGQMPESYGGHKITGHTLKELSLRYYTVEGLSREDIEYTYGSFTDKLPVAKIKKPRKLRTELYYQILGSKNRTVKTLKQSTLPNDYREMGITNNQIKKFKKGKSKI